MIYEFAELISPKRYYFCESIRSSLNILPEDTDLTEMGFQQEDAA